MTIENKRIAASILVFSTACAVAWLAADIVGLEARRGEALERIRRLPQASLAGIDQEKVSFSDLPKRPTALVFFSTSCPYCDSEISDLVDHAELFSDANVVLISPQDIRSLRSFSRSAGLDTLAHFTLGSDTAGVVGHQFGVRRIPSVFIYDAGGHLVDRFSGITSATSIAEALGRTG